ncbi:UNKNOWN [Stylonychia lemnae]|uniref:Ubiquitin-like domain-containing protein n=1 Tax=Stylonychia lemnae TaxID=5949 RepID=A0A078AV69_STYLE|nr:UNKNOWN [Stylonychia lemnae]|eukprot:CDW86099.1 UNKNOWN [Stylonychia lemnae]
MESISYQINVRKILLSNGRIVSESTFTVQNVQEFLLVQHLKRRILGYTAISCDEQRIVFAGKLLEDDVELNSYGMKNKDIVMLFAGQRDFEQYFEIENRVEMVIPDILKDEGICQQQLDNFESDFHQSIDKEAQVVELLPHDIFFKRTVELQITAKPQANYAIFIQKNTQPAKDLDIWRTIPCQSEEDGLLKLRLNTFSNMFVSLNPKEQYSIEEKITEQEMKSSNVKFHKFEPGLNFVISKPCDDESCSKAQNFPIQVLPLYYLKGEKLNISELDEYKCPCGDELNPYQISQIIIMLAQAKIIYAKDLGPGKKSPTQKIDLVAKGNDIMVIGNGQPTLYSKFIIWVKPAAKEPQEIKDLAKAGFLELNENGNAIGKMFQLSNDSGVLIKVLVGKFFNREGFTLESFNENAGNDLRRKKFEVEVTEDVDQFVKLINGGEYSSAMIISDDYQASLTLFQENSWDSLYMVTILGVSCSFHRIPKFLKKENFQFTKYSQAQLAVSMKVKPLQNPKGCFLHLQK